MFFRLGTPAQVRRRRECRQKESMRLQEQLARLAERGCQNERRLAELKRLPLPDESPAPAPAPITLLLVAVIIGVYVMDRLLARDALAWIVGGTDYAQQLGALAVAVIPIVFISVEIWLGYHLAQVWREFQEDRAPGLWVAAWALLALLVPAGVVAAVVYANWGDWATPVVAAPFVFAGHVACVMSGTHLDGALRWLGDLVARWRRRRVLPQAEKALQETRNRATATLQRLRALHHEAEADEQNLPWLPMPKRAQQWLVSVVGDEAIGAARGGHDRGEAEPPSWASKARELRM